MNNKILLISPVKDPSIKTPKALRIPEIALSIIASFTPSEFEVKILEEEIEPIDFSYDCGLVGISCMSSNAPRAYEVAMEFRRRGKKVVLGGIHPTVLPEEAKHYADSVVIGEAEGSWEKVLEDYKQDALKPFYRSFQPDVSNYPPPRRNLSESKGFLDIKPVLTTRGCPYDCDFCCVPKFFGRKVRHLPVEKVVHDIQESQGKVYLFLDDNIIGHPKYAKELFKAVTPLNIKWVGQASVSFVKDTEMMELAKKSGCVGLFFGVESVSVNQLNKMRKSITDIKKIDEAIQKVKDIGIMFHASMVLGFDDDTKSVFDDTLEFLMRNKIGTASLNILTPYPGTELYHRLDKENRILTKNWKHYDHGTVVYKPKNMTPMELAEGYTQMKKEYFSWGSIFKRLSGNMLHPLVYLGMNVSYQFGAKKMRKTLHSRMEGILKDEPNPILQISQTQSEKFDNEIDIDKENKAKKLLHT